MADIVIFGAGYTGRRVASMAREASLDVVCTRRVADPSIPAIAWQRGALPEVVRDSLQGAAVVCSIPPTTESPRAETELLRDCADAGARRFVYLSATSVYGDHDGDIVTEASPVRPSSAAGLRRLEVETALFEDASVPVSTIRIAGIYGPTRTLVEYVQTGRYKLVDGGQKMANRIHVDDLASIVVAAALDASDEPHVWLAADGRPRRVIEIIEWLERRVEGFSRPESIPLAEYAKTAGPNRVARWKNSLRCDGSETLRRLGVELQYEDVLAGYAAIW